MGQVANVSWTHIHAVLGYRGTMDAKTRLVWMVLAARAEDNDVTSRMPMKRLQQECGISHDGITRAVAALEALGFVRAERTTRNGYRYFVVLANTRKLRVLGDGDDQDARQNGWVEHVERAI